MPDLPPRAKQTHTVRTSRSSTLRGRSREYSLFGMAKDITEYDRWDVTEYSLLEWQGQSRSTTADRSRGIRGKVSPQLGGRGDGAHVAGAAEGVGRDGGGVGVVVSGVAVAAVAAWAHGTDDDVGSGDDDSENDDDDDDDDNDDICTCA